MASRQPAPLPRTMLGPFGRRQPTVGFPNRNDATTTVTPGVVVVLPEPAGDGGHTVATAVGVRGAAADITGVATAVGVMAPAHGGGVIERPHALPNHKGRRMADLSSLAGDISSAGAALAGLILVFLGHTAGTFENYDPSERAKVKDRFRKRATLAFIGFVFALFACLFALIGEWQSEDATLEILVAVAGGCLVVSSVIVLYVAAHTRWHIRLPDA